MRCINIPAAMQQVSSRIGLWAAGLHLSSSWLHLVQASPGSHLQSCCSCRVLHPHQLGNHLATDNMQESFRRQWANLKACTICHSLPNDGVALDTPFGTLQEAQSLAVTHPFHSAAVPVSLWIPISKIHRRHLCCQHLHGLLG